MEGFSFQSCIGSQKWGWPGAKPPFPSHSRLSIWCMQPKIIIILHTPELPLSQGIRSFGKQIMFAHFMHGETEKGGQMKGWATHFCRCQSQWRHLCWSSESSFEVKEVISSLLTDDDSVRGLRQGREMLLNTTAHQGKGQMVSQVGAATFYNWGNWDWEMKRTVWTPIVWKWQDLEDSATHFFHWWRNIYIFL